MTEKRRPNRPLISGVTAIVAAAIVALSVVFAALYVSHVFDASAPEESAVKESDGLEDDGQASSPREEKFREQVLTQLRQQAKKVQILDVQAVRFTHNDKAAAFELIYSAAQGEPQQTATLELTEDDKGRYVGAFTIGPEKVNLVVY